MKVIGLTGGIGSGKSTVANLFEILGCAHFSSDKVAKQVYFLPEIRKKVVALLGPLSYLNEKTIDTAYVSSKVFGDTELLHRLNEIIHPAVIDQFDLFCRKQSAESLIIKESALLFEAKLEHQVHRIIVVAAPEELRIARVMERDSMSRENVIRRIKSQLPQEEKIKQAHYVIQNNETDSLIAQVMHVHKELLGLKL